MGTVDHANPFTTISSPTNFDNIILESCNRFADNIAEISGQPPDNTGNIAMEVTTSQKAGPFYACEWGTGCNIVILPPALPYVG